MAKVRNCSDLKKAPRRRARPRYKRACNFRNLRVKLLYHHVDLNHKPGKVPRIRLFPRRCEMNSRSRADHIDGDASALRQAP